MVVVVKSRCRSSQDGGGTNLLPNNKNSLGPPSTNHVINVEFNPNHDCLDSKPLPLPSITTTSSHPNASGRFFFYFFTLLTITYI